MRAVLAALAPSMVALLRSRASLHLEILALRHQLAVLQGSGRRPQLKPADRLLWAWLSRAWSGWQDALVLVKPSTVISWQRKRFRDHWTRLSRRGKPGRPPIAQEIRDLIRKMSRANPCWGSLRIRSELRKLGIDIAKSTVEKYRVRPRKPPSPTWRAFLANHTKEVVSLDFFTVSTARFHVLFVLIILAHDRRRVVHFNITKYPTARWTAQHVVEAFPWDTAPRFLLRDRDGVYGTDFRRRVRSMGIEEVIIAARSPWQSPYVERMIASPVAGRVERRPKTAGHLLFARRPSPQGPQVPGMSFRDRHPILEKASCLSDAALCPRIRTYAVRDRTHTQK